jgi:hypothetical protein
VRHPNIQNQDLLRESVNFKKLSYFVIPILVLLILITQPIETAAIGGLVPDSVEDTITTDSEPLTDPEFPIIQYDPSETETFRLEIPEIGLDVPELDVVDVELPKIEQDLIKLEEPTTSLGLPIIEDESSDTNKPVLEIDTPPLDLPVFDGEEALDDKEPRQSEKPIFDNERPRESLSREDGRVVGAEDPSESQEPSRKPLPTNKEKPNHFMYVIPSSNFHNGIGGKVPPREQNSSPMNPFVVGREGNLLPKLVINGTVYQSIFIKSDQWSQAPPGEPPKGSSSQQT